MTYTGVECGDVGLHLGEGCKISTGLGCADWVLVVVAIAAGGPKPQTLNPKPQTQWLRPRR